MYIGVFCVIYLVCKALILDLGIFADYIQPIFVNLRITYFDIF